MEMNDQFRFILEKRSVGDGCSGKMKKAARLRKPRAPG